MTDTAAVTDEQIERKAFRDWAWEAEGPPIGTLSPSKAAEAAWMARAALAAPQDSAALREAYIAGATAVHEHYKAEHPDIIPRGDPEFGEAASDYAARAALSPEGTPTKAD